MAFGIDSNNPRELYAYAHAKLTELRSGKATYVDTLMAILAASQNRDGRASELSARLGKIAVLLVEWVATCPDSEPGLIHHNFGGFVMPGTVAVTYSAHADRIRCVSDRVAPGDPDGSHQDEVLRRLHEKYDQVHDAGYEWVCATRKIKGDPRDQVIIERVFPQPGIVVNPAAIEGVMPYEALTEAEADEARMVQL